MQREIGMNYENMNKNTVILLSKAKQSKAKPLLYLLTNNINFYIPQFFKAFKFLSVSFLLHNKFDNIAQGAKATLLFKNIITRGFNPLHLFAFADNGLKPHCYKKWIATPHAVCLTASARNDNFNYPYALKNNFAILNLVKTFLTSITFDNLSRKIKNPCLVINKFINRRVFV